MKAKQNKFHQIKLKKMFKTAYLISEPNAHIVMVYGIPFAAINAVNMPNPFSVEIFDNDVYLINNVEHLEPIPPHNAAYFSPNTDVIVITTSVEFRPNERPR